MLKIVVAAFDQEDAFSCDSNQTGFCSINSSDLVPIVIPLLEVPSIEEILADYRRLKKPYIQPVKDGLRYRKNYFIRLPSADRNNAQQALMHNVSSSISAEDIVDQTCRALHLEYEIRAMSTPPKYKRFCLLDTKYDCVIIDHIDIIFSKIIDYFKTMLNLQNPAKPCDDDANNNF